MWRWTAIPKYQALFFVLASLLYAGLLIGLLTGRINEGWKLWAAAIGGTVFFPFMASLAWWEHRRTARFRNLLNRDDWFTEQLLSLQPHLQRRVTVAEGEAMLRGDVPLPDHLQGTFDPQDETWIDDLQTFAAENSTAETELWFFDTGEAWWNNDAGRWGFAIVREGKVTAFLEIAQSQGLD